MNKIKEVCGVDFCILHNYIKNQENTIALDSYYGVTRKA